jgi:ATP-dependent DNA helicase RecQ
MRGYAETLACRRRFLLGYFGEAAPDRCGACDACTGRASEEPAVAAAEPVRARRPFGPRRRVPRPRPDAGAHPYAPGVRVRHEQWGEGEVMSDADGKLTVLFDSVGYRTLSLSVVTDRHLLAALPTATG